MRHSTQVHSVDASRKQQGRARGRVRTAAATVGALAVVLTASGCTANEAFFLDLPEPATEEGAIVQNLWQGSWIAAWLVGLFTWAMTEEKKSWRHIKSANMRKSRIRPWIKKCQWDWYRTFRLVCLPVCYAAIWKSMCRFSIDRW